MGQLESYRTHGRLFGINSWKCTMPCEKCLEILKMANERHLFFSSLKSAFVQTCSTSYCSVIRFEEYVE